MLLPMILGIKWMDPEWLLQQFHNEFVWLVLVIIFVECGLFFPFLPGDTLLFAVGLFVATGKLDYIPGPDLLELAVGLGVLTGAAFLGNVTGYEIGRGLGHRIRNHDGKIMKKKYLDKTDEFFDRHGSKALVIGRFVPFVRTYITLVAGVTRMKRQVFFVWSGIGAVAWVCSLMLIGYGLGQTFPSLGKYIDLVTYGLLAVTVVGLAYEIWKKRQENHKQG